ncbi:MAG TPA: hypothetical protein VHU62_08595 [Mycobacterium sp.]|jgi:NAD(P)-dependent dehydrogenase (short-subunit alcohol dehydrogenase family)|nr:hypothetical protein [Mycobacterium sp.]
MSKPWFITGNSRGLGLALATVVLTQGDRVVANVNVSAQAAPMRALV